MTAKEAAGRKWDVVIIGGGHNGLVCAAYLAKRGLSVLVLEKRSVVGGAATTQIPWGPDFKVSTLSYVVSLFPEWIVRDLKLPEHGYEVIPLGSSFSVSGGGILFDPADGYAEIGKRFGEAERRRLIAFDVWLEEVAALIWPLLATVPPAIGSKKLADLFAQLRLAWRMRNFTVRSAADLARLFSMSISDLLEEWFEEEVVKGIMAVNGVIGTWAGPMEPGTAYVMIHHSIGNVPGKAKAGTWGFARGGMGAVSQAIHFSAEAFGAAVVTDAPVEKIIVKEGRATGVVLSSSEEIRSRVVVAATHPAITFLKHIDERALPSDFVKDIRRWKSRSGVVKINLALAELPRFEGRDGTRHLTGAIEISPSLRFLEEAFLEARSGTGATRPMADCSIPSILDDTLAPKGAHVMGLFTQWVPSEWSAGAPEGELEAYADRMIGLLDDAAPGFRNSVVHRQVIGPREMEEEYGLVGGNIFHGELSVSQLFHLRPAPGFADYRSPIHGLYQASSATHGGGGVTGIPGWQAARAVVGEWRGSR